jgi:hypothetical protein
MSAIHELATLLAERIVPDDVELAPAAIEAMIGRPAVAGLPAARARPIASLAADDLSTIFRACAAARTELGRVVQAGADLAHVAEEAAAYARDQGGSVDDRHMRRQQPGAVSTALHAAGDHLCREGVAHDCAAGISATIVWTFAERPDLGRAFLEALDPPG